MRRPRDLLVAFVALALGVGVALGAIALTQDDDDDTDVVSVSRSGLPGAVTTAPRTTAPNRAAPSPPPPTTAFRGPKKVAVAAIRLPAARVRIEVELRAPGRVAVQTRLDESPAVRAWARNPALDARGCDAVGWFVQLTDASPRTLAALRDAIPTMLRPRTVIARLPMAPGAFDRLSPANVCRRAATAPTTTGP